jgi:hypothetical protein
MRKQIKNMYKCLNKFSGQLFLPTLLFLLSGSFFCIYEPVSLDYYDDDGRIKGGAKPKSPILDIVEIDDHQYDFIWTESIDPDNDEPIDDYFLYYFLDEDIDDFYNKKKNLFWRCSHKNYYVDDEEYCETPWVVCIIFTPKKCWKILNRPYETGKLKVNIQFYNVPDITVYFSMTAFDGSRESYHSNLVTLDL